MAADIPFNPDLESRQLQDVPLRWATTNTTNNTGVAMANTNHNQTITLADNPLPQKRKAVRKPAYNTKWSKIFKAVQDTGKRQELVSSDGLWTTGQMVGVTQNGKRWSNRNGFGQIKIQTRAVRLADSGPRHEQYAFRIWATVPTPKVEPTPAESSSDDVQRLIDQILAL